MKRSFTEYLTASLLRGQTPAAWPERGFPWSLSHLPPTAQEWSHRLSHVSTLHGAEANSSGVDFGPLVEEGNMSYI